MSFFKDVYTKNLSENEKNIRFWEEYVSNLQSLDLSSFAEKLKVPVLVPIGSRIFFRGELKHTNEVTTALGADYFTKCSLKQAEELRQHRIKGALLKLNTFKRERDYLDNQLSFRKENIFENQGQEIIEYQTDEEDKAWREKHRLNVKEYMQIRNKDESKEDVAFNDEDLFYRLEELELQEELENELLELKGESDIDLQYVKESFPIKERFANQKQNERNAIASTGLENYEELKHERPTSKHDLIQKVLEKQMNLEKKLIEIRNKEISYTNPNQELLARLEESNEISPRSNLRSLNKTEQELIARLEAMEELDELEDEMDRLDDIIETEYIEEDEEEEDTNTPPPTKMNRCVSFADEDDSETLELTFTHSNVEPVNQPYDPKNGISRPSDIYKAYSSLFSNTTSILKKSKYKKKIVKSNEILNEQHEVKVHSNVSEECTMDRTIIVKDIVEKVGQNDVNLINNEKRPVSLFKKKRQQMTS